MYVPVIFPNGHINHGSAHRAVSPLFQDFVPIRINVHEVLLHWALVCWSSILLGLQTGWVSMKTVKTYKKQGQAMMWC